MSEATFEATEDIEAGQAVEPFPVGKNGRGLGKMQRRYESNPEDEKLK